MPWETPSLTEFDMNAEIGAYQEDDGGDRNDPVLIDREADEE